MMVDLPQVPLNVVTSATPRSSVSPAQIAAPYSEMADSLDKVGGGLDKTAEAIAHQQGLKAVTLDSQGNVQVEHAPYIGPAAEAYSRAVKFAALTEGEGQARRADIEARQQFRDNPDGYLAWSNKYIDTLQKQYTDAAGPEVGLAMRRSVESTTTQTYRGLLNEKERLDLARAEKSIDAGIKSTADDLSVMARGGVSTDDPAYVQGIDKFNTLIEQKVNNPRLAYPREQADLDKQRLQGELGAQRFLYHVDQTYKGADADVATRVATDYAKDILTNPAYKLSPSERQQYYARAVTEIRANDAIRRQDIGDLRTELQTLRYSAAAGIKIDPQSITALSDRAKALGWTAGRAEIERFGLTAPLISPLAGAPLSEQAAALNSMRGNLRQQSAFDFFVQRGWSPVQAAGIVGGLRGETGNLSTTQLHDNGIGIGIAGWNAERRAALNRFAAANGKSATDLQTQLEFVDYELRNNEAEAGALLKAARTPEDAGNAMLRYFRPANYDVPGAHPERAQYARAAFNAFGTEGGTAPAATDAPSPGWLVANRSTDIARQARAQWKQVWTDWQSNKIRPPDKVIDGIIDAAKASGDVDLLATMRDGMGEISFVHNAGRQTLSFQHALAAQFQSFGEQGTLPPPGMLPVIGGRGLTDRGIKTIGNAAIAKDLEHQYTAISEGLDKNPIATTVAKFGDKFNMPGPLNLQDPRELVAGLALRGQIANFARQNWGGPARSALDQPDLHQLTAALDTPNAELKGHIFAAIDAALPEDIRKATLAKIGEKRPDFMVASAAGGLMSSAPDIAQSILRGQAAIKADKEFWPKGATEEQAATDAVNKAMPPATFSLAARTDPMGPYATAHGMIKARYADLSAAANDASGKLNSARLTQAINDVTGGVLSHNGGTLIAPVRGMSQADFDRTLAGVTDADLAGVTTLNGAPVTADYLRGNAQLESIGDGKYLLRLGRDAAKPIYAYQGATGELPQKFVLNLRGRPLGPQPGPYTQDALMGGIRP